MDEEFDNFEVDEVEVFDEPMEVETFDEPMEIDENVYDTMETDDISESMDLTVETLDDTTEIDEDSLIIDEAMSITDDVQNDSDVVEMENSEETDISSMSETTDSDPMQDMTEYMNEHNYGRDDYEIYSKDPEYQAINDRLLEADGQEPLDYNADSDPMQDMMEYMSEHNYGRDDYETYSKDPEYQAINDRLLEADGQEPLDYNAGSDPMQDMTEYMNEHNYGREDYETYSKDPEYQAINDRLLEADGQEPIDYGTSTDSFESELSENVVDEMDEESAQEYTGETIEEPQEELPEGYEETVESENEVTDDVTSEVIEEPQEELPEGYEEFAETDQIFNDETLEVVENNNSEVVDSGIIATTTSDITENEENYEIPGDFSNVFGTDEFEEQIRLDNPEFYETGSFYEQGVNEFGYEGTCGPTSQANAINALLGTNEFTENKVLSVAIENELCETRSLNPADNGGTTTDQFMELYGKINEKIDGKLNVERYDFENALSVSEMADKLDEGAVLNIAVDADTLWDVNNHIPGVMGQDKATDHWITVTGVDRNPDGTIAGFKLIDSGGGVDYADVDKYERMCFGEPGREMLDPTCIVVSKKDDVGK